MSEDDNSRSEASAEAIHEVEATDKKAKEEANGWIRRRTLLWEASNKALDATEVEQEKEDEDGGGGTATAAAAAVAAASRGAPAAGFEAMLDEYGATVHVRSADLGGGGSKKQRRVGGTGFTRPLLSST